MTDKQEQQEQVVEEQEETPVEGQEEEITFTEAQQAKIDEIVSTRLAREKEKWEKENPLKGDLETTTQELEELRTASEETKRQAFEAAKEREFNHVLHRMNVYTTDRVNQLRKLVNLEGVEAQDEAGLLPNTRSIEKQVVEVYGVMPEVFGPHAKSLHGSIDAGATSAPMLTREQVEKMSPEEVNARWDEVQGVLARER